MKTIGFTLYGLLIGALFAIFGGILFGAIIVLVAMGIPTTFNDIGQIGVGFGFAGLYSVAFALVPGATGGAYLSHWLGKSERTPREVTRHGLLIGAVAGLIAAIACLGILRFSFDWVMFGYAVIAIAVASGMSFLAAKYLAKKKKKFIRPQP
jgi:hypothetical protein